MNTGFGFFQKPAFQALTVGVPFCVFKLLFGILGTRIGTEQNIHYLIGFGWLIVAWALIDLMMNLARTIFDLTGRESPIEYCTIAQIGRLFHCPRVFLAADTFLSFSIISFMLWSGWIKELSIFESYLWYGATTLNLISISIVNLWTELGREHAGSR